MIGNSQPLTVAVDRAPSRVFADCVALTKPGLVAMVLVTTAVGFYLGSAGSVDYLLLIETILGTGLCAGGVLALNQYIESDLDAKMERTRSRPLPDGRIRPVEGLLLGAALTVAGLLLLTVRVHPLSGMVTAATAITYLFWYTPMKLRSPLCSVVGAIPGALPPVAGWVAAGGSFDAGAGVLFAILFLWQLPHSLAIAMLYRDDYARAGFRLLPIVDRDGHATERQIVSNSAALLVVGLVPTLLGMTGALSFFAALALGGGFLACGVALALSPSKAGARRVLLASLVYLPVLLAVMAIDKVV